jgi:hypothetical protein
MGITLTGPMQFSPIEQVGSRRVTQFGQLDQLVSVFIGPDNSINNFPINSPHTSFPLMFVVNADAKSIPGGLSEVTVTTRGKMLTNGATSYIGPAVTEEHSVQGSRDFQTYLSIAYINGQVVSSAPIGTQPIYNIVAQTTAVRYIGRECRVRYQAYPRPTSLHYSSLGLSRVSWTVLSSTPGSSSVVVTGTFTPQSAIAGLPPVFTPALYAANLGFDIVQNGLFFDCVEIYGPTF